MRHGAQLQRDSGEVLVPSFTRTSDKDQMAKTILLLLAVKRHISMQRRTLYTYLPVHWGDGLQHGLGIVAYVLPCHGLALHPLRQTTARHVPTLTIGIHFPDAKFALEYL